MNLLFRLPSLPPSVCNTVHLALADGDGAAGGTREGHVSIRRAADLAEADGAGHQHAATGYSASAGHSVAAARLHQVS